MAAHSFLLMSMCVHTSGDRQSTCSQENILACLCVDFSFFYSAYTNGSFITSIPLLRAQVTVRKAYGEVEAYVQMFFTLALDGED